MTADGNYTSKIDQAFSPPPPEGIIEFFSALHIFFSITASLGNGLILIALKNVSSIHPPTKVFLRCLAVTDLGIGLIVQPFFATYIMSRIIEINANVLHYVKNIWEALGIALCGVSIATSTAISVDRLLALLLGLRYRHVVTLRRIRVIITCFWLISPLTGWLRLYRVDIANKVTSVASILCLVTSIFCYTRIHLKLRNQQAQVQNIVPHGQQNGDGIPLNMTRYRKTVSSSVLVQLAFVTCYGPWVIVSVLYANAEEHFVAWIATLTLVLLNSSLNPFLYCWKIREVKQAVKGIIRELYCF